MKKLIALLIGLVMLCTSLSAFADGLDLSVLKNNDLIEVEIDNDGDAFVNSIVGHTRFDHEKSLDDYPSYVYSDIIIGDYYSTKPITLWRFWVSYSAAQYLGITSFSLVLDDTEYTFKNVGNKDNNEDYSTNVRENPHIAFGSNNMSFWLALLLKFEALEDKTEMFNMSMKMILHGTTKDIEVTLPGDAMVDLAIVGELYLSLAGLDELSSYDGTEMTETEISGYQPTSI